MVDLDPVVLGLAALSGACFLAFALWPPSSPRGQLEAVPAADDSAPTSNLGRAAVRVSVLLSSSTL
jgi:hypothetical protein